jgi:hypothetical protein
MAERHKFHNNNWPALIVPWIFFPLTLDFNVVFGIFTFIIISVLFWIFTSKLVVFHDDYILVKKYKWFFSKQYIINYNEISFIYFTIITLSASYNSNLTIHFIKGRKEKVTFNIGEFAELKKILISKTVKIKSNNNEYI